MACIAGSAIAAPNAGTGTPPSTPTSTQRSVQPDAAARLERYPTDLDFLLAVDGLAVQRSSRAGLAAERFLSAIGAFDRTGDAWSELSNAMGMQRREAVDALLGQHATVAVRTDAAGVQQIAVRSTIRRDSRERVSSAFKPSPRGLIRGIPVLSLGNGSIEMAVFASELRGDDGSAHSELILAPRGSGALFEDMLRATREPSPDHALDLAWASLRSMGPSPIALLLRGAPSASAPQEFFALTARPSDEGWSADFVATRSMLDAGTGLLPLDLVVEPEGMPDAFAREVPSVTHPEALARTMRDDALLFMSGPVRVGAILDPTADPNEVAHIRDQRERMPITAALSRFSFSEQIWSKIQGVAFVSVHTQSLDRASSPRSGAGADSGPPDRGIVMCVALPVSDVSSFASIADAWGLSFAKGQSGVDAADPASQGVPLQAVRAMEVHGASEMSGLVGARGAIAWTFATAAGQDESLPSAMRGWWIICAQAGDARAQDVVDRAKALALAAASPGDASGDIVFRLMSRPALMREVTHARDTSRTSTPAGNLAKSIADHVRIKTSSALDVLDRVEVVIRRRPTFNELFDGSISIQMRSEP